MAWPANSRKRDFDGKLAALLVFFGPRITWFCLPATLTLTWRDLTPEEELVLVAKCFELALEEELFPVRGSGRLTFHLPRNCIC